MFGSSAMQTWRDGRRNKSVVKSSCVIGSLARVKEEGMCPWRLTEISGTVFSYQ